MDAKYHVIINGLNIRPGGGLVVLQAICFGLMNSTENIDVTIILFNQDSYEKLSEFQSNRLQIVLVSKKYGFLENFLQARQIVSVTKPMVPNVLISLNHLVPRIRINQLVYHVNLSRFQRPSEGFSVAEIKQKLRDWSSKSALTSADVNVFESQYVLNAARERYKLEIKNPKVIYIGVQDSTIKSLKNFDLYSLPSSRIVVVSSPNPHKRNDRAIEILSILCERYPLADWRIDWFGGHNKEVWWKENQQAKALGVLEKIEFHGYQPRTVLNSVLDSAVCLLSTSAVESFCMVALEAMARGCPAVVSDEAAMPESLGEVPTSVSMSDLANVSDLIEKLRSNKLYRLEISNACLNHAQLLTWSSSGIEFHRTLIELTRH